MKWPVPRRAQLGTGALVLAALSLGQVLVEHLPSSDRAGRPFEHEVGVGQTVALRTGTLTVTGVDGARSVQPQRDDRLLSPGVIVVVTFDFTPRVPETTITYGEFRDAKGRTTALACGARSAVSCPQPPVGITSHCTAIVEAAPRTLAGARLTLGPLAIDAAFRRRGGRGPGDLRSGRRDRGSNVRRRSRWRPRPWRACHEVLAEEQSHRPAPAPDRRHHRPAGEQLTRRGLLVGQGPAPRVHGRLIRRGPFQGRIRRRLPDLPRSPPTSPSPPSSRSPRSTTAWGCRNRSRCPRARCSGVWSWRSRPIRTSCSGGATSRSSTPTAPGTTPSRGSSTASARPRSTDLRTGRHAWTEARHWQHRQAEGRRRRVAAPPRVRGGDLCRHAEGREAGQRAGVVGPAEVRRAAGRRDLTRLSRPPRSPGARRAAAPPGRSRRRAGRPAAGCRPRRRGC